PDLDGLAALIHARSEQAMRRAIAAIPDGEYRHAITIDGYKTPVRIACAVGVSGETLTVDYTGTSPQSDEGAINVVPAAAWAATLFPLKCSLTPAIPNNEGLFSPIRVHAPEGCILNARFPAAVRSRSKVSFHIHSAIYGALADLIPECVQAGS